MAGPALIVRVAANLEELKKNLKEGKDQIEVTSSAMARLSTSFNGEKLVQAAHNTTAAIQKVGVATLNTAEGARSLDLLDKAMDKLLRTGQQVPAEMMKTAAELRRMARAGEEADKTVLSISQNYRQFDGILQSLGINIGPYVKGLDDLTAIISKGVPGLGFFGAAAAAVGVALASWKIGTFIGETSGLTDAIARGTAVMRGYGDVAQETSLAVADSIDLLGKAEANWKRQAEGTAAATKAAAEHTEEMRREGMVALGNEGAFASLQQQLDSLKAKRLEDARAAFAASQAQSIFGEKTKETTVAVKEQTHALDERAKALKKIAAEEAARKKAVEDFMTAPTLNNRVNESQSFDIKGLTQTELQKIGSKDSTGNYSGGFDEKNVWQRLDALSAMEGNYHNIKSLKQYSAMMRDTVELAQLRMWAEGKERPPGFAGGVTNFSGGMAMVGERGPELVRLPRGSDVIPNHALGGVHITIAAGAIQMLWPVMDNPAAMERTLSMLTDGLMERLHGMGFVNPSPA